MTSSQREKYLKIGVAVVVGLFLLDWLIISPFTRSWAARSERIEKLEKDVSRGKQLLDREEAIRTRWAEMLRTDLPNEVSAAENEIYKAVGRWVRESRISLTSLTPQWRTHEEGYTTLEARASATGDQAALGRFLYEMEVDPLPVRVHETEITARDAGGKQTMLTVRFSFVRLSEALATAAPAGRTAR